MGDLPTSPNRPLSDPRNTWHSSQGQRRNNILFGDAHVAYSKMPETMPTFLTPPYDINGNPYGNWW
jgi:prepilin-type processing-associated H-X9-DG protein